MLINNLENLEKKLDKISDSKIIERSFSEKRIQLLQDFYSELKLLKSNNEAKSLSLYIRSLLKINFSDEYPKNAFGLGIVIHYGPGNLPINSIYSWITGFICGNINIVRSSTKITYEQLEIINLVSDLCLNNSFFDIFTVVKDSNEYAYLTSKYAQARVIWGSNTVVNKIRKLDCSPKCRDIIFSDRKSAAIFNIDLIAKYNENRKNFFISALANDLLYADSQPCTSPSVLFLISRNNEKKEVLKIFKSFLVNAESLANKKDAWNLSSFSNQLEHLQYYAVNEDQPNFTQFEDGSSKLATVSIPTYQKRLFRTFEVVVVEDFDKLHNNFLNEFNIFICEGLTKDQKYFLSSKVNCTRVTTTGNAHQFNLIWDGIDTVRSLIRIPQIS